MVLQESMNLTPAESLMLLDPEETPGKKMIKLTFADLTGQSDWISWPKRFTDL